VVTPGLAFYEIRGIQKCNSLRRCGYNIEDLLGIYGQFRLHPPRVYHFIGNTLAASVIYPAVLAAWTSIVLVSVVGVGLWTFVPALFVLVIGCVVFYNLDLTKGVEEEPNKSSILRKMLNCIDRNLQADADAFVWNGKRRRRRGRARLRRLGCSGASLADGSSIAS